MYMLTKRTNILFEEKIWNMLTVIAQKNNTSVGDLVRTAVIKVYLHNKSQIQKEMEDAMDELETLHKQINHTFTSKEIKELIEYGRKY